MHVTRQGLVGLPQRPAKRVSTSCAPPHASPVLSLIPPLLGEGLLLAERRLGDQLAGASWPDSEPGQRSHCGKAAHATATPRVPSGGVSRNFGNADFGPADTSPNCAANSWLGNLVPSLAALVRWVDSVECNVFFFHRPSTLSKKTDHAGEQTLLTLRGDAGERHHRRPNDCDHNATPTRNLDRKEGWETGYDSPDEGMDAVARGFWTAVTTVRTIVKAWGGLDRLGQLRGRVVAACLSKARPCPSRL